MEFLGWLENTWIANEPGSLLAIPVADIAQHHIANLCFFTQNGFCIYDDLNGRPIPGIEQFAGLVDTAEPVPLSFVEQYSLTEATAELMVSSYNGALLLQAMGLGGWTYDGIEHMTLLGASGDPEIPGLGSTAGLELNLQARSGQDIATFNRQVQAAVADIGKLPETPSAATTFRAEVPQVYVTVDRETAKARGVKLGDLFATLQAMLSALYINDFNLYGRTYRVQAEAQSRFRQSPDDIGRLFVRAEDSDNKEMIPLSALTKAEFRAAPSVLTRFNGFTSALVTAAAPPGVSSGQQLDAVERVLNSTYAAEGVGYGYSGQSFQERASSGQGGLVFGLGLILVFLVLAAQYESWSIPFAVILGVPFGVFGAFLGVWLRGLPSDIYFQVGLITVVGLAAKNAILIVEFANDLRSRGLSVVEAAAEAARERFRPILMTSFAFIFGVAPLMVAGGAGAASRHSLGTGVFAGMLTATMVGIFFIPLFFALIRRISERLGRREPVTPSPEPAGERA